MKHVIAAALVCGALVITTADNTTLAQSTAGPSGREWTTYGHDPGGMRFSPLTQLTPANVTRLQVAWVYHMKPAAPAAGTPPPAQGRGRGGAGSGFSSSEVTPLVANGMM